MEIPKVLHNPEFRFIRLNKYKKDDDFSKAPLKGLAWKDNLLRFDDPILLKHIKDGGNVGWVAGPGNIRFIDIDKGGVEAKLNEKLNGQLNTLIMQTGSGNYHMVIKSDYAQNHRLKKDMGEYRADGQYVVCAPSIHPCGKRYKIFSDVPIVELDENAVDKILKPIRIGVKKGKQSTVEFTGPVKVIPDSVDSLIKNGVVKGKRSRHEAAWIITKELYKRRFENEEIVALVQTFNDNCTPKKHKDVIKRHVNYLLNHPDKYLVDKVDTGWLKAQSFGAIVEELPKNLGELIKDPLPDINYWMSSLIPKNLLILIGGRAGSFKSMFTLSLALCMARGRFFLKTFRATGTPSVLLYDLENGERVIHRRTRYILKDDIKKAKLPNFHYLTDFDKKNIKKELKTAMRYDIVILDSYRRFLVGSENESEITDAFYREWLKPLRESGKTVIIVHHFRKSKIDEELSEGDILELFRGSGDIGAQVDYALALFKANEVKKDGKITFDVFVGKAKNRLGIPMFPFAFRVTKDDEAKETIFEYLGEKVFQTPAMKRRDKIIELIKNGFVTRKEILKHFPLISVRTIDRDLKEMAEREIIIEGDKAGTYGIKEDIGDYV